MYVYQDNVSLPEVKLKNFNFDWKDKSVIELGCNVGKLGIYVLEAGASSYKGFELDKQMVKIGTVRYGLDLVATDVINYKGKFEADVVIAMALFHHFGDEALEKVLSKINSKELVFEIPVGTNDVGLYNVRTKGGYAEVVEKLYGKVVEIVDSGATNDPYNKRVVFYCRK